MDTLFHGVVGAMLCSRAGLAGGRRGPVDERGRRQLLDWTFWVALFFGVFPDLASLGIHFSLDWFAGNGVRWHGIHGFIFTLYNLTHSLAGMAVGIGGLVMWKRALWLPALAWPIHVLMDLPTHGSGSFMTPILWPFSDWRFRGWSWWEHSELFYGGWIGAGVILLILVGMRWSGRNGNQGRGP